MADMIYVVGAGGHARVVVDALLAGGADIGRISVSDNNPALAGSTLLGIPVCQPAVRPEMAQGRFHVAVGAATVRARLHRELVALGARPLSVIHPAATVSRFSSAGAAVFIAARAVLGPEAELGDGVIVNHGAVVDHNCRVGAFSHVAPNATLAGAVRLGTGVLIGAGANILPGVHVDDRAVVGAGAVVLANVAAGHIHVGVPAKSLSGSESG